MNKLPTQLLRKAAQEVEPRYMHLAAKKIKYKKKLFEKIRIEVLCRSKACENALTLLTSI
jgi:hypothetical protein